MERRNSRVLVPMLYLALWVAWGAILNVQAKEPDVDYVHPDLAANMWVNSTGLNGTSGVGDDGNSYVDDTYGADTVHPDGDPADDRVHTTSWTDSGDSATHNVQASGVDVPILMYHDVWDTATPCNYWSITKDLFEKQMQALSAYGYDTVSLQDFLDYRNGSATPPDHPIILTFDDGHYGLYTAARPVLNSYGFMGTGFLTTDWMATSLGPRDGCEWDTMLWSEAATMLAEGHAFESHTKSHPYLTSIPAWQAQEEIEGSKTEIENQLGNEVQFFAYPSGDGFDNPNIRSYVQQAGYQAAVAAYPDGIANTATSDIWALPRIYIVETHTVDLDPAHPEDFFMRKVDPDFPLPMLQVTSVRAFDTYGRERDIFYPGELVNVIVQVINNGDDADLVATLNLDIDANDATPPIYDSSSTEPSGDVAFSLAHGQGMDLNFYYQLPQDATTNPYYYALVVRDVSKTLGFLFDGWTELLTVTQPPICNDPHEPNDATGEATPIGYGTTLTDPDICPAGDVDFYSFSGHAGDSIVADIDAESLGSSLDSYLYLYDTDGVTELAQNDDYDGYDSHIEYVLPADGTYYLKVREYSHPNEGSPDHFYTLHLNPFCHTGSEIPLTECKALIALYYRTDGPNWTDHTGWLDTSTPCSWYGVTCGGGHVTQLDLSDNQLSGNIPPELGDLASLEDLDFGWNQLSGSIPPELGNLTNLQHLGLGPNQLNGTIPPELGNLANLLTLRLENNALGGEVPASITNLTNLTDTDLGYNVLTASDPDVIAFLNGVDPDWAETQTVPPDDAHIAGVSVSQGTESIELAWTPIPYTADGGYYEIGYATNPGGPYTFHGTTDSKNASGYTVDDLPADPPAYFLVVRSHTPAHGAQQNALWSDYSPEMIAGSTVISPLVETIINAGMVSLAFPPGAVSEQAIAILGPVASPPVPSGLAVLGRAYALQAWAMAGEPVTSFQRPLTVTVEYGGVALSEGLDEASFMLYVWDEGAGEWGGIPSQVDVGANRLVAGLDRAATFAVLGRTETGNRIYLPTILQED